MCVCLSAPPMMKMKMRRLLLLCVFCALSGESQTRALRGRWEKGEKPCNIGPSKHVVNNGSKLADKIN